MRKIFLSVFVAMLFSCLQLSAQTLIHYWNFNTTSSYQAHLTPSVSVITGSAIDSILYTGGNSLVDVSGGTGQGFDINNYNARNGDLAGNHLRFNNPVYGALLFSLPTTGYKDVVLKYASMRSSSGAYLQLIDYTIDGNNYTRFDTVEPTTTPTLYTLDFSTITAANNNANFKVRISFAQGGGGLAGNNRIDNFTMEGTASGGDVTAPSVSVNPQNNATNVAITIEPTFSFNEDVRLVNDSALNNTNVDTIIELRLDDATGALVAFDASINGNIITVTPQAQLLNNQKYFLTLKENRIEDFSDNAIPTVTSFTFTTLALQTVFGPGDILPVAYRMSADGVEDEVALITLVDILPGTIINITDAKYTENAVAQCSGGLTWMAPVEGVEAGTIINIKTAVATVNIGSLTGTGFGLSSGGDQFIVYTGMNTSADYITALSSNIWLTTNTSCSGSESLRPPTLADGVSSIQMSTVSGAVSGNTANAYYNGQQSGTNNQLRLAILNPANWIGTASGTAPQVWPTWDFSDDTSSAQVNFVATSVSVGESTSSTEVKISITPMAHMDGKITVKVQHGSGVTSADYTTTPALVGDSLVLNVNRTDTIVSFVVNSVNDTIDEQDEIITFNISNTSDRMIAGTSPAFAFTITDDDTLVNAINEWNINGKQFVMYPNPNASGQLFFSEAVHAEVYDITGKLVLANNSSTQLNVATLTKGIYVIRINGTLSKKLIIE